MHVVHVLHTLATGGMEKGVTTLVRHASPGFSHTVVCLTKSGAMARRLPEGTPVIEMHKPPGNSLRFLWRLARRLKGLQADVVHTRNWGGLDGVVAARLAGLKRVVHGEHGWEMADAEGKNERRRKARRFLQRWVREYTCVSKDIREWLQQEIRIRRPITQIYNGVDTDALHPGNGEATVRRELGLGEDAFVAGIVGRLDPIKDHPTLFRAVTALREQGRDIHLLVAGDGPERERLTPLAGEGIHLLGNRGDVPAVLQALDVFVLTSFNEGISNTILEAMATGLPVVATRVGGNPELVDEGVTGRLIEPGDVEGLARILGEYASDGECRARDGAAGRQAALERFSIRRMVSEYEAVWARVGAS